MGTNDFLAFATDGGANVIDQAAYVALAARGTGFQAGIAESNELNKTWRQAALMAAALGKVIVDNTSADATDDGDVAALAVKLQNAVHALTRQKLLGNRTYYVSAAGNDANNGDVTHPWLTLQHSWDWCQQNLDLNGFTITVQIVAGTLPNGLLALGGQIGSKGAASFVFLGDAAAPATYNVSVTNSYCFAAGIGAAFTVVGVKMFATGSVGGTGFGLYAIQGGTINHLGVSFGTCAQYHIAAAINGNVSANGDYAIAGNAIGHVFAQSCASVVANGITITLAGTPAWSGAFAQVQQASVLEIAGVTFAGTGATGIRYAINLNGVIYVNGGGANYLPGNAAGGTSTGGQYA